jgi:hypothetical protein
MTDAYIAMLPGTALGAIGGSLIVVGMSLVVAVAVTFVALTIGGLVQRVVDRPAGSPTVVRLVDARDRAA